MSPAAIELHEDVLRLVPDHEAARLALALASHHLPQAILNHSLRVFIYATAHTDALQAQDLASEPLVAPCYVEPHTLFVACVLHDLGAGPEHDADDRRFEVVGANHAAVVLRSHGVAPASTREAWLAMSLHTTPGVPDELRGTTGALRLAIATEFRGAPDVHGSLSGQQQRALDKLPRLDIERVLGDAVVRQALGNRAKAPAASWAGQLLCSHEANPGWDGVNKAF